MSRHQKCCYKAHTNTHARTQIILTSHAPLPLCRHKLITLKIESSYADSESCVHVRSGDAHELRRKHTCKQKNISLRETQTHAAYDQKLLIPHTHTHTHTHTHLFILKMKDTKLKALREPTLSPQIFLSTLFPSESFSSLIPRLSRSPAPRGRW